MQAHCYISRAKSTSSSSTPSSPNIYFFILMFLFRVINNEKNWNLLVTQLSLSVLLLCSGQI